MKGFRGVVLACVLAPMGAMAQVPVSEGSSGNAGTNYPGSSVAPQTTAGLSGEGQLYQQLYQLQQEVTMLRGLLEEQGYKLKQMERDQLERYEDIDRRLSSQSAPASSAAEPITGAPLSGDPAASAPEESATPAPADPEREKLLYDASFDFVKTRDFDKAIQAFTAFLRRYPDSQYAGNAQYWLGEVYLVQSDLDSAGKAFAQVISRYPDHRKGSDAMYKLGEVERRLGHDDKARDLFQQVVSKYPDSSAAQLAGRELNTLN
ncbi:tol-pal system protein YbgF [Pseudomonas sp. 5Ae-yellow]|uniref:tol-pal system protein YbgF n=1 Tax=Pseudomonas sp. 5Ae-yellow TaxID=2759848 RepID=UPI0015F39AE3|nr:tol-pal system protein YbgF [Pseudomonas sp. 5Ae-yellow]MBA6421420.1 tol-pal system protein YbgF [Pseudomonas sp. 5Ae-yellow]